MEALKLLYRYLGNFLRKLYFLLSVSNCFIKYSKIFFLETIRRLKLKLGIHVYDITLYISYVFIVSVQLLLLLWQQSFHRLIMGNLTKGHASFLSKTGIQFPHPCTPPKAFLARLHEVQKSYCSHPGRTRSRSRSTLLKFSRSLYLGNHSSESIHTWTIGTQ